MRALATLLRSDTSSRLRGAPPPCREGWCIGFPLWVLFWPAPGWSGRLRRGWPGGHGGLRWTLLAHMLTDVSGVGAALYRLGRVEARAPAVTPH